MNASIECRPICPSRIEEEVIQYSDSVIGVGGTYKQEKHEENIASSGIDLERWH